MGVGGEVVGPGISGTTSGGGGGSGTVTSVSVVSANGLAGTVANPTTTPAITLSTSVTGILKGNGTTISAATAGTDYPATGVISAGGPTGSSTVVPVITWNANGQLTAVTTAATVGSVAATDTSIVVGGTATAPTIATGTLDVIATQHPPVAAVPLNAQKITGLANGSAATDAAAFGQIPTSVTNKYTLSTVTADPAPAVIGTYYRTNYAGNGNFTLPTTPATGSWVMVKQVANNTLSIVGTVDGNAAFTMVQFQSYLFIYNGTNWDIN